MRIAGIRPSTTGKIALATASIAAAIGTIALTSCAETKPNLQEEYRLAIDYKDTKPNNTKLMQEALDMANKDPDVKSKCQGHHLNLLQGDTFECNDGRVINFDITTAIKEEQFPNGEHKTTLFEDNIQNKDN